MGKNSAPLRNFNAGELSPDTAARIDNPKYAVGCSTLSRYIPRLQGPARRCPGTRYVQPVKSASQRVLVRKFIFSQAQAYVVEFGVGYCRFYTNHGQVQVSGVAAWNNATAYQPGALVTLGGLNYYCFAANTNQSPPNATYWYPLSGTIYEIPSPLPVMVNTDGTPALQIEQSGDVLYIATPFNYPVTLTRFGPTNWVFNFYNPPDGPFLPKNLSSSPALYAAAISGSPGLYDIYSTAPVFSALDAPSNSFPGRLIRIDAQTFNTAPWSQGQGVTTNSVRRNNGNTYLCTQGGTTGSVPPIHTYGIAWDGANPSSSGTGCCQWLYQDSGYGIAQVTSFISSTHVKAQVTQLPGPQGMVNQNQAFNFPAFTLGTVLSVSAITQAKPAVVTVSGGTPNVGDPVYLTGIGGMTQISERMFIVQAVAGSAVTLAATDSSAYSAFTSGGSMIVNASLNWALGAWAPATALTPGQYPQAVCFWEDRLFWGWGINWAGSAPGAYTSQCLDLFSQVTAACGISGIIASKEVDAIGWMNAANILLIGTPAGEFGLSQITSTQALGPGNVIVEPQSHWRSKAIKPELINTSNFYVQRSGKKVMSQDYNFYLNRYDSTNQNRMANHIAGYTVASSFVDVAYHPEPYQTLWCLRSDGILTGYTIDRQDQVEGWHEHPVAATTGGAGVVESICVIPAPDGTRDELWLAVKRTIGGLTVRSIEYLEKDFETGDAQASMCFLDMSTQYSGAPITSLSLPWLIGETIQVLANGGLDAGASGVVPPSGIVNLTAPSGTVQAGLPYASILTTMDVEGGANEGTAQGKIKRPSSVVVRLKNTWGPTIQVAGSGAPVKLIPDSNTTVMGAPPPLFTGDIDRIGVNSDPIPNCKLTIAQNLPFQCEVLGIFPHITVQEPSPP
jgi:hypothetical protein